MAWREGRSPNRLFDAQFYAAKNRKLLECYPNGFSHFLFAGEAAGLSPNPFFSPAAYLAANPDIAGSGQLWSAFHHLWHGGRLEGWRLRGQPNPAAPAALRLPARRIAERSCRHGAAGRRAGPSPKPG